MDLNNDLSTEVLDSTNKTDNNISSKKTVTIGNLKLNNKLGKGINALCKTEKKKFDQLVTSEPSKYVFIIHFGNGDDDDKEGITIFLQPFGTFNLTLFSGLPYGYIEFENIESAKKLIENATKSSEDIISNSCEIHFGEKVRNCFFFYTKLKLEELHKHPETNIPDASTHVDIPGLIFIEEFISKDEEQRLIHEIEKQKWTFDDEKKFQNYGFEYNFQTNSSDKAKSVRPLNELGPSEIYSKINEKAREHKSEHFDQITIEESFAGSGIPPRLESHRSFEGLITILNLGSGVVWTWKNDKGVHKHQYIPQRSLVLLSDEARNAWTYSVPYRKIDKVNGQTYHRKKRITITLRKMREGACKCQWPHLCDCQFQTPLPAFENVDLSETGGKNIEENKSENKLSEWEKKYVYNTYEKIAPHFSTTRYRPWPKVEAFLNNLPKGTLVADVGCGNGRYLGVNSENIIMIGTDRSENFMKICKEKGYQVFSADSLRLPLRNGVFDCTISIAVIHHFSTRQLRIQALTELARITKRDGLLLVYVWAMEQDNLKVTQQDVLVPWNLQAKYESEKKVVDLLENEENEDQAQETEEIKENNESDILLNEGKKTVVYKRYYHMFKKGELEELVGEVEGLEVQEIYYDNDNWCVILKKKL